VNVRPGEGVARGERRPATKLETAMTWIALKMLTGDVHPGEYVSTMGTQRKSK
jgi:hypothetical protein